MALGWQAFVVIAVLVTVFTFLVKGWWTPDTVILAGVCKWPMRVSAFALLIHMDESDTSPLCIQVWWSCGTAQSSTQRKRLRVFQTRECLLLRPCLSSLRELNVPKLCKRLRGMCTALTLQKEWYVTIICISENLLAYRVVMRI